MVRGRGVSCRVTPLVTTAMFFYHSFVPFEGASLSSALFRPAIIFYLLCTQLNHSEQLKLFVLFRLTEDVVVDDDVFLATSFAFNFTIALVCQHRSSR